MISLKVNKENTAKKSQLLPQDIPFRKESKTALKTIPPRIFTTTEQQWETTKGITNGKLATHIANIISSMKLYPVDTNLKHFREQKHNYPFRSKGYNR